MISVARISAMLGPMLLLGGCNGAPAPPAPKAAASPDISLRGAMTVVQEYAALIRAGRPTEAARLWRKGDAERLAQAGVIGAMQRHTEARLELGAPGRSQGAAGAIYLELPGTVIFTGADGHETLRAGTVILRRANGVPGATLDQLSWRIVDARLSDQAALQ